LYRKFNCSTPILCNRQRAFREQHAPPSEPAGADPYHFAILDYQMPGMDGAELARAVKGNAQIRETVVVLLTSVSQWIDIRQKESGTIDASLVKLGRQSQLLSTLSTAWSKKHQLSVSATSEQIAR
jgi:CheY-like chemotaxis protein